MVRVDPDAGAVIVTLLNDVPAIAPLTSKVDPGVAVPIPTFPLESIRILSKLFVANNNGMAMYVPSVALAPSPEVNNVVEVGNDEEPRVTPAPTVPTTCVVVMLEPMLVIELVPIPTLPIELIRMRSAPAVDAAIVSAAGDQIPVFKSPVNVSEGVPTAPRPKATEVADAAPRVGVTNVGLVARTISPVPVLAVH